MNKQISYAPRCFYCKGEALHVKIKEENLHVGGGNVFLDRIVLSMKRKELFIFIEIHFNINRVEFF